MAISSGPVTVGQPCASPATTQGLWETIANLSSSAMTVADEHTPMYASMSFRATDNGYSLLIGYGKDVVNVFGQLFLKHYTGNRGVAILDFDNNNNIIRAKNFNSLATLRYPKYDVSKFGNNYAVGFSFEENICVNGQIFNGQPNQRGIVLLTY